jgi:hypothetical protein
MLTFDCQLRAPARGFYDLGTDVPPASRLADAFAELGGVRGLLARADLREHPGLQRPHAGVSAAALGIGRRPRVGSSPALRGSFTRTRARGLPHYPPPKLPPAKPEPPPLMESDPRAATLLLLAELCGGRGGILVERSGHRRGRADRPRCDGGLEDHGDHPGPSQPKDSTPPRKAGCPPAGRRTHGTLPRCQAQQGGRRRAGRTRFGAPYQPVLDRGARTRVGASLILFTSWRLTWLASPPISRLKTKRPSASISSC